jgi:hypothetical protein
MPSWRVTSAFALVVAAVFGIAFGAGRLLRGGAGPDTSRPQVVEVAHSRVATFGPPARLPALRTP